MIWPAKREIQGSSPNLTPVSEKEWDVADGHVERDALRLEQRKPAGLGTSWGTDGGNKSGQQMEVRKAPPQPFPATVLTQKPTRTWPWRGRRPQPLDRDSVKTKDGAKGERSLTLQGHSVARGAKGRKTGGNDHQRSLQVHSGVPGLLVGGRHLAGKATGDWATGLTASKGKN